jgi:magnesium transporter
VEDGAFDYPGVELRVLEFDFERKSERTISVAEIEDAMAGGRFVWLDVDFENEAEARQLFADLDMFSEEIVDDLLTNEPATQAARYPGYLHFVVSGCKLVRRDFDLERVDCILGEHFLFTVHRGPVVFLKSLERDYKEDFIEFARSPSFMVYEIWEHLIDNYLSVQKRFEERVEELQTDLMREVDDRVFASVSELGADLLHFRKVVLPARAVLADLSSRKSLYISEATQPFLANMVGTIERVLQDLLVDRDVLANSLNLYMSIVQHRTNDVMKKLTVLSTVFLPLTFLCGVYGMNFKVLPELEWRYGYLAFWIVTLGITFAIVVASRRAKLL